MENFQKDCANKINVAKLMVRWNPKENINSTFSYVPVSREKQIRSTMCGLYNVRDKESVLELHKMRVDKALQLFYLKFTVLTGISLIFWLGVCLCISVSGIQNLSRETIQIFVWFNVMSIFSTDIVELIFLWLSPPSIGKPTW